MKKFDNLQAAIHNLKDIYSYQAPYGNVEMTGMVGLYEICFEQAWKAMKEILTYHGYAEGATGSPRTVLKTAYKAGLAWALDRTKRSLSSQSGFFGSIRIFP